MSLIAGLRSFTIGALLNQHFTITLPQIGSGNRVAIYIRVSTLEQMTEGFGLEAQEQSLRQYLKTNTSLGLQNARIQVFRDTDTGSTCNRKGLQALVKAVQNKRFDVVVVWKIDRLARVLEHLIHLFKLLQQHNASLVSVQEHMDFRGPMGQFIFHIFSSVAELERSLIKSRTFAGRIASAKLGNYTGTSVPYGYTKIANPNSHKGSVLQPLTRQSHWVRKIFRWYVFGSLGAEAIASKLNDLGVPYDPPRKKKLIGRWSDDSVLSMLQNSTYRGTFIANKKDVDGHDLPPEQWTIVKTPALVDPLLWQQAQNRRKRTTKFHGKDTYLLSGKIHDGDIPAHRTFIGVRRTKGGISYRRKRFTDTHGTSHPSFEIPGKALENHVWKLLEKALDQPELFYRQYLKNLPDRQKEALSDAEHKKQLLSRITQIEEVEIVRILSAYEKGIYSDEITRKRLADKEEELTNLREQIESLSQSLSRTGSLHQEYRQLEEVARTYRRGLRQLSREQKKALCDLMVEKIVLHKDSKTKQVTGKLIFRFDFSKMHETGSGRTHAGLAQRGGRDFAPESPLLWRENRYGLQKSPQQLSECGKFCCGFKLVKLTRPKHPGGGWLYVVLPAAS